jgi:hypothetical protein
VRKKASSLLLLLVTGCAPGAPALPSGASTPFPAFQSAFEQATAACRTTRTLTASMALSGRAGSTKLHGRVDAGFEAPARARLEGIAPFGKPVFVLVADGAHGSLVLPREDRVLSDAPPDRIFEALAGVPLDAGALRTIVSGCGFGADAPSGARRFSNGWASAVSDGSTVYLRQDGSAWQIAAAARDSVSVFYGEYVSGRPATVRIRVESNGHVTSDLTLRPSEVEVNTTLDPRVFDIRKDLPPHPVPLSLDELRRAGPLGGG